MNTTNVMTGEKTNIVITKATRDKLKLRGYTGDSYDTILNRLMQNNPPLKIPLLDSVT